MRDPIRTEWEYVEALREISWLWNSHTPGSVERMEELVVAIEEYERACGAPNEQDLDLFR